MLIALGTERSESSISVVYLDHSKVVAVDWSSAKHVLGAANKLNLKRQGTRETLKTSFLQCLRNRMSKSANTHWCGGDCKKS